MKYTSKYIEEAVEALMELPSIGKKSALRMVLYLLGQHQGKMQRISNALQKLQTEVHECQTCHAYADEVHCHICSDGQREGQLLCLVENIRDLMAIEDTNQFRGKYHVLGGVISPLDGRGPEDLHIQSLLDRIQSDGVQEIIMAIPSSIEGETTIFYISQLLRDTGVRISVISRGVSFASELEYADEITLGRSIASRIPYQQQGAAAY